jgi:hypothetical protein
MTCGEPDSRYFLICVNGELPSIILGGRSDDDPQIGQIIVITYFASACYLTVKAST